MTVYNDGNGKANYILLPDLLILAYNKKTQYYIYIYVGGGTY